jgi:DNA-directed RNA polymerase subunit M/transcription elongation factor TFIIS
MIPDSIREEARSCLATCVPPEHVDQVEAQVVAEVVEGYLKEHNTSDRALITMYQYLIRRCIERAPDGRALGPMVSAPPWEWAPLAWKEAMASDTSEQQVQSQQQEGTPTNQFLCTKCGQRKCIFSTAQTRSADEGMTTFITCLHCGKNWKMN